MLDILLSSESFDIKFQNLKMFLLSPTLSDNLEQLGFKKYTDDTKIICFDNMAKIYAASSKSKGRLPNDQKQFEDCLMTSIVHTPSPETVSTLSEVTQNKVSSEKRSLGMQLMSDALSINRETLSKKFGKAFSKRYALKTMIVIHFSQYCRNRNGVVKSLLWQ